MRNTKYDQLHDKYTQILDKKDGERDMRGLQPMCSKFLSKMTVWSMI